MDDERLVAGLHCGEVVADLTEHLDGRLSRERTLRIDEHLQGCSTCRRLGDEIAAIVRLLRELPDEPLAPAIEARLVEDLRAEEPLPHG
ncbi:MAG TPA: zf-HC2 domain-containing protein [Thermoanaerobaculia bacterium]|nr:zf-HC2 domain-containing protein [Thermoanaerobaculia bacterium]